MADQTAARIAVRPVLSSTEAQVFVADITASCNFYTEKLRFTVAFVYGEPPNYGQVTRDEARLNLRVVGEPVSSAIFESASTCRRRRRLPYGSVRVRSGAAR